MIIITSGEGRVVEFSRQEINTQSDIETDVMLLFNALFGCIRLSTYSSLDPR